jgi:hypothetical protein
MATLKDRVFGAVIKLLSILSRPVMGRPAFQRIAVRTNPASAMRRRR